MGCFARLRVSSCYAGASSLCFHSHFSLLIPIIVNELPALGWQLLGEELPVVAAATLAMPAAAIVITLA